MNRRSVLAWLAALCIMFCFLIVTGDNKYTELTFSENSGFYEDTFQLEIFAPAGTEIYYTLDGSVPDEHALKYTEPILINDATANQNVYSVKEDVTAGFLKDDILTHGQIPPDYMSPSFLVDKCTVIRAAYMDADGNFSETKTQNYFIGYQEKTGYDQFNIISIVAEPDDLFGYKNGIYTLGYLFDHFPESEKSTEPWAWWDANYHQHGIEWERSANVQFFNTEKELLLDKECGIRIQGGASRGFIPRSMNLYARKQYDGEGRFYVDLFGTNYMADTVTLFAGGGDVISKLRDRLAAELVNGRNFGTMHFKPYIMFLNGEYWGVYWLTEKYDDVFLAYYYDIDKNDAVMIKNGTIAEGNEADYALYAEMSEYMENTDFTIDENYNHACEILDMQSFIDYFVSEIYFGRHGDWPVSNFAVWRTREKGNGKYEDCRWRWLLFDVNSGAFKTEITDWDVLRITMDNSKMFNNLCQNDNFKRQFVISCMDLINTSFSDENVNNVINSHMDLMETAMGTHLKRFMGAEDNSQFHDAVIEVQSFMNNRTEYVIQHLINNFGLSGVPVSLQIDTNDTYAGNVIVNTAQVIFDKEMSWHGKYFTDYQISVTAVPHDGYRFVRWEGDLDAINETISVNMKDGGCSIKAVFEKR